MIDVAERQEEVILKAARKIFLKKGFQGARMQEIADAAGINKALLHYYFRSKEKLFESVLDRVMKEFFPALGESFQSNSPLGEKIRNFVDIYFSMLSQNAFIPQFVISELNRDPDGLKHFIDQLASQVVRPVFTLIDKQIQDEVKRGSIRRVDTRQLMVNIISMCLLPFIANPILRQLLFDGDEGKFAVFLEERRKQIPEFVINALRP